MNPLTQSKNTTILPRLIPLVLACFALLPSPALADVVTDWNAIALQTALFSSAPAPWPVRNTRFGDGPGSSARRDPGVSATF